MPSPERIGSDTPNCHAKGRISCQHGCIVFAGPLTLRPLQEEDVPLPGALDDDLGAVRDALKDIPGLAGNLNTRSLHSVRRCASVLGCALQYWPLFIAMASGLLLLAVLPWEVLFFPLAFLIGLGVLNIRVMPGGRELTIQSRPQRTGGSASSR